LIVALFYSSILASLLFWWALDIGAASPGESFAGYRTVAWFPDSVLQLGEERWAKRVLGLRNAAAAEFTRYSECDRQVNFHMQLRAIYKLVLEWPAGKWLTEDRRLVEDRNRPVAEWIG
jgi:hypothetical protein